MRLLSVCTFQPQPLSDPSQEWGLELGSGCSCGWVLSSLNLWKLAGQAPPAQFLLSKQSCELAALAILSLNRLTCLFFGIQGRATELTPLMIYRCTSEASYLECSLLLARSWSTPLVAEWAITWLARARYEGPSLYAPEAASSCFLRPPSLSFFPHCPRISHSSFLIHHNNGSSRGSEVFCKYTRKISKPRPLKWRHVAARGVAGEKGLISHLKK